MSEATTVDLMVLVDDYIVNKRHEQVSERTRLNAIYTNPAWLKRYPAWKAEQKKAALHAERPKPTTPAADSALVNEWLTFENKRREDYNKTLTTGSGLPLIELGVANGQVTFENALFAARQWFADRQNEYDDNVTGNAKAFLQFKDAEEQRANAILREPYPANGIGRKYLDNYEVQVLTEEMAQHYLSHYTPENLKDFQRVQKQIAAKFLDTTFTPEEAARIDAFVAVNNLDIMESSYVAAFKVLVEEGVIRRKPVSWSGPTIEEPKLPTVAERVEGPQNPYKPGSDAFRQWDREQYVKGISDQRRQELGPHLQEIATASGMDIPASLSNALLDELIAKDLPLTRYNIRKTFALLRGKEIPAGVYSQAELDGFETDREEALMSAEDYRTQTFKRRV